jgi:hypothetical protein
VRKEFGEELGRKVGGTRLVDEKELPKTKNKKDNLRGLLIKLYDEELCTPDVITKGRSRRTG